MIKRNQIFNVIKKGFGGKFSAIYDTIMLIVISLSLIPLMFRSNTLLFEIIDRISTIIFIIDYILRWITADFRSSRKGIWVFIRHPFTFWAIIDLLSILPGLFSIHNSLKILRISRLFKILRVLKFFRYSKEVQLLMLVLKNERRVLLSVLILAISYIFVTALIMFNYDTSFENFFVALYWATTTLTTVGYGDVCPSSDVGRFISMISAVFGVAIIALPSGIITANYLKELNNK